MNLLVVGGGSFGTALAQLLADAGQSVSWWMRDAAARDRIRASGENSGHHPGTVLPRSIQIVDDVREALASAQGVVLTIPSQAVRPFLTEHKDALNALSIVVNTAKGLELATGATLEQVARDVLGDGVDERFAVLSGPSFARELIRRMPTAVVVAARSEQTARIAQHVFRTDYFRCYSTPDVVGVELAGALKNVMAVAAGAVDGLQLGANARAAMITRGLHEMKRLGEALGADRDTFSGLAGLGDLILTCTGDLSRNRTVGMRLGRGETLQDILASMNEVAEGVVTSRAVYELSKRLGISMPISQRVYEVLYENKPPRQVVEEIMARALKPETE